MNPSYDNLAESRFGHFVTSCHASMLALVFSSQVKLYYQLNICVRDKNGICCCCCC